MTSRRGYTGVLLAALAAIFLAKDAEGESAEMPPLQLDAKIPLGDVRGRIDHMRSIWPGTVYSLRRWAMTVSP